MATLQVLLFFALASTVLSYPPINNKGVNKIFAEEKLEGGAFYNIEDEVVSFNNDNPYRLPTTTKPIHYNLNIWMRFNNAGANPRMYGGAAEIELKATQSGVNEIVLHADYFRINNVTLKYKNVEIPVTFVEDNPNNHHFLRVSLRSGTLEYSATEDLKYLLTIVYEAPMRTDMTGIYESWYKVGEGENDVKYMASTHFQATAARRAFPCYDEPNLKATFKVTIRRPIGYKSWTNTRLERTNGYDSENEEDVFTQTPIMPTYLIAIIVADYATTHTNGILKYEVIARPDAIRAGQAEYALNVGKELLEKMSEHTKYDFYDMSPNLKMTQAAIPDFSAGAMENWGLLVYREAYLMYDSNHTDSVFKQRIAGILSHEIAHMWFGNLVTCNWWDVFWLNEGFARYYQYFLTHWVESDMGLDTRFVTEQVHTAFLADSGNNPHPLTNPGLGGTPTQIRTMFSSISYNKGSCVIRMTEHLLGFEVHRRGLQNYLRKREFSSGRPEDLFEELQSEANSSNALTEYGPEFSVIDYYKSFTEQPGHPVLIVHVNHQTGDMTIMQRRFNILTGFSTSTSEWIVPISFASASNPDFSNTKPTHIVKSSVTIINRGSIGDEWVLFNKQQTGFYRIFYDDYTWDLIAIALRGKDRTIIHEHNKAQIVNDAFDFARSGLWSYARALNILSFLEFETSYAPWVAAMTGFTWIRNRVAGHNMQPKLEKLIIGWSENIMSDIGYNETGSEPFMRSYLRYQLAPIMCQLNAPNCRTTAVRLFNALKGTPAVEVPVDSRAWVYCNALREGTEADFNFLWNRYLAHHVYTEKILLLQTLGCTSQRASLYRLMDAIVETNYIIRPQDLNTAYNAAVTGNEENKWILLDYIENNMAKVKEGFGSYASPIGSISSRLRSENEITRFRDWATKMRTSLGDEFQRVYDGAQSSLNNMEWANAYESDFNNYFDHGYSNLTTTTTPAPNPDEFVPQPKPELQEPEIPNLPDSASTAFMSLTLIIGSWIVALLI